MKIKQQEGARTEEPRVIAGRGRKKVVPEVEIQPPPIGSVETLVHTADVDEVAQALKSDRNELAALVHRRLGNLDSVSHEALLAAMSPAINLPTGDLRGESTHDATATLAEVTRTVKDFARRHPNTNLEELVRDGEIVRLFVEAYHDALGVQPIAGHGLTLKSLVSDFGEQLLQHAQRPLRLIAAKSQDELNEPTLGRFYSSLLAELEKAGVAGDASVLGGFNATGASQALYHAAEQFPSVRREGVMAGVGIAEPVAAVDLATLSGVKKNDEEALYLELASSGFLIGAGLNRQGKAQIKHHLSQGGFAVVLEGLAKGDGIELAQNDSVLRLRNVASDPAAAGKRAARFILDRYRERRTEERPASVSDLNLHEAPGQIVEVEAWTNQLSIELRTRGLVTSARDRLVAGGLAREAIDAKVPELSRQLDIHTHGIDPAREPSIWQVQVKQAFAAAGEPWVALANGKWLDVLMGSWFALRDREMEPAYFETTVGRMPDLVGRFEPEKKYTLDVSRYVDFRLGDLTKIFLGKDERAPEVFLGTKREMLEYYRAKGFKFLHSARKVHGMEFHVLRNREVQQVVVQGVDSPERSIQLAAFLKSYDIDPGNITVRGDMDRQRELHKEQLELKLGVLGRPIAAVVVGNQNQAVETLAEMSGKSKAELDEISTEYKVGPFSFRATEVIPAGETRPHLILSFDPAYGSLTEDLTQVCAKMGARNFMNASDGGSLLPKDRIGAVHQVEAIMTDGPEPRRLEWKEIAGLSILDTPKVPRVLNRASVSPLEQDEGWAERSRSLGCGNTDQEMIAMYRGLQSASELYPGQYFLMPTLIQSDVVGHGKIETGKRSAAEQATVRKLCRRFFDQVGLAGGKPGLASQQAGRKLDLSKVEIRAPDLATMADSQAISTVAQFKGQKRVMHLSTDRFDDNERERVAQFLRGLDPNRFWVVLDVADQNHGELDELARKLKFETLVVGTKDDLISRKLQSTPTFFVKHESTAKKNATLAELLRDATQDEDGNPAQQYRVHVGARTQIEEQPGVIDLSRHSSAGVDAISASMIEEMKRAATHVLDAINWRRNRLGLEPARHHDFDQLDQFFGGRSANVWSCASRLSWSNVAPRDQEKVQALIETMALVESPQKTVQVTGATAYGPEEIVQEVVSRDSKQFDLLAALTENTGVSGLDLMKAFDQLPREWRAALLESRVDDRIKGLLRPLDPDAGKANRAMVQQLDGFLADLPKGVESAKRIAPALAEVLECIRTGRTKWEVSDHVKDFTIVSINWAGQARQLLRKIVEPFQGQVTSIGGGEILAEQIRLQFALGITVHLMDGIDPSDAAKAAGKSAGASVDIAHRHPAHAFTDVEELCKRKGLSRTYDMIRQRAEKLGFDLSTVEGVQSFARSTATRT